MKRGCALPLNGRSDDLTATRDLIDAGKLSLAGLITHHARPDRRGPRL